MMDILSIQRSLGVVDVSKGIKCARVDAKLLIENRRERVRCIVVLEGLESLTEGVSYIRRIIHSLYMELDVFSARSTWLSDNSVLFITTVDNIANIPQGLIKCDKFGEIITLTDELKDREGIEECLKLYLTGRCDDFESLGIIANELMICGINRASTVALFCKEAIIYAQHATGTQEMTPLHIRNFIDYYKQKIIN